jgi:hypothetical protein
MLPSAHPSENEGLRHPLTFNAARVELGCGVFACSEFERGGMREVETRPPAQAPRPITRSVNSDAQVLILFSPSSNDPRVEPTGLENPVQDFPNGHIEQIERDARHGVTVLSDNDISIGDSLSGQFFISHNRTKIFWYLTSSLARNRLQFRSRSAGVRTSQATAR